MECSSAQVAVWGGMRDRSVGSGSQEVEIKYLKGLGHEIEFKYIDIMKRSRYTQEHTDFRML
jgi:hypothetical protein